ncbi:MAG: hypothetical protein ACOC1M_07430, partial [Halanaerobium sp.]
METNQTRKFILTIFIVVLSIFLLTGCDNSNTAKNSIDNEEGYIEGYIYQTSDGEYVFDDSERETPVT